LRPSRGRGIVTAQADRRQQGRGGLHYAWIVAGATFLILLAAAGMRAVPGVLIDPLNAEFGWSRGQIGLAVSVNVLLFGLMGPFAAALMGRYGLRLVISAALALIAVGLGLSSQVTSQWQLIVCYGVLVGLGSGCMASVLAAAVANRWFVARRGLVTGLLTAGSASGQIIFLQFLTRLSDAQGWRWVSYSTAAVALAAIPIAALVLRNRPEDVGLRAYGAPEGYVTAEQHSNPIRTAFVGLRDVSRLGGFWLLFGGFLVCGVSTNGLIGTHFIPAAGDHDIHRATAAGLLSLVGIFDIAGTILSGWLSDRVDPRYLLAGYYAMRGFSLLFLYGALEAGGLPLWVFMVFYGLDWVATVPPTVRLCSDVCGVDRGTVAYGWVYAGHQIGAAIMAWFAGFVRDTTGSYQPAFIVGGICCMIAAAGSMRIRRPLADAAPEPDREPVPV
jgi:predicted MFS family arabinose efflux permease